MTIAVLAVQGAFIEHEKIMNNFGVTCIELRQKSDLFKSYDGIILPGGESTVQGKLLKELDMYDILKEQIEKNIPTMATCAGLILLSQKIINDERVYFKTLPVTVRRNAYGRQLGSFFTKGDFGSFKDVPMNFIRAPFIQKAEQDVKVMAKIDGNIVGVKYKNQIAMAFHPELSNDLRIHNMFFDMMKK